MPFSAQIAAACTVRGSSPSGSTMRCCAARAACTRRWRNTGGGISTSAGWPMRLASGRGVDVLGKERDRRDPPARGHSCRCDWRDWRNGSPWPRCRRLSQKRQSVRVAGWRGCSITSGAGLAAAGEHEAGERHAALGDQRGGEDRVGPVRGSDHQRPGRRRPISFSGEAAAISGASMRTVSMSPRWRISKPRRLATSITRGAPSHGA